MGIKENIEQAVLHAPDAEEQQRYSQHQENIDPLSHLKPGAHFDPEAEKRVAKQRVRRAENMQHLASMLMQRVTDPGGSQVLKISWLEYMKLRQDEDFIPFSRYASNLLFYADGSPRPKPVRPLVQNEVGTYRGKLVILKDSGPDDAGEGKYYTGFDIGQETKQEKNLK